MESAGHAVRCASQVLFFFLPFFRVRIALVRCYLDYCRKSLQMKIHPKLHILEKHVVPWLHTINMGLGPVSEHGVGPPSIQHSVPKGKAHAYIT